MATAAQGRSTPFHLWIVAILAIVWNALGCYDYFMSQTRNEKYLSMMGSSAADTIAYLNSIPAWAVGAWAVGVWGALAGSVLLAARSRFAVLAYALSLLGLLASIIRQYATTTTLQRPNMIIMELVIWVIAIFLLCYARSMEKKGVLR